MKPFQFKQFTIEDSQSTMKVGTDAVLLGAWAKVIDNCKNVLDIGCGCGIISLMLAQRTMAQVYGVDIHPLSVEQAKKNAKNSIYNSRLDFYCADIHNYKYFLFEKFDLVVSNPPYFINSLHSPKNERNLSRHIDKLSYADLASIATNLLTENGHFCVILPEETSNTMISEAEKNTLSLSRCTFVFPKLNKKMNRVLLDFSFANKISEKNAIFIRNEDDTYHETYRQLTKDFYTIF